MFANTVTVLDWFGTAVFAVTGGLMAARHRLDIFGFVALAIVTGIGGGTIRDLILDVSPVTWVTHPEYLRICMVAGIVVYFAAHIPQSRYRLLMWLDAVGLSLFCVVGAARALELGAAPPVAVLMGIGTATFGGMLRNLLVGETSVLLDKDVYPAAAFAGAATFVAGRKLGVPFEPATVAGFAACFAVRGLALYYGWQMPVYTPRKGEEQADKAP